MRFQNILVNATPSVDRDLAMAEAVRLARRFAASVTICDVVPDLSWLMQYLSAGWEETIEGISGGKEHRLKQKTDALAASGIPADYWLAEGRLSVAIVRRVLSHHHDLVVKVAEGPGPNRSGFLGSTDCRLLRKCPCPVLILKEDEREGFQHVAAALDVLDNHEIQQSLDQRVARAAEAICDGDLQLIYALRPLRETIEIEPTEEDQITPEVIDQWESELRLAAQEKLAAVKQTLKYEPSGFQVLTGAPAEAIPEFVNSRNIDLLVVGTIGRSGLDGLLIGNTAEQILSQVDCSILALKPVTFVSPLAAHDHYHLAD